MVTPTVTRLRVRICVHLSLPKIHDVLYRTAEEAYVMVNHIPVNDDVVYSFAQIQENKTRMDADVASY